MITVIPVSAEQELDEVQRIRRIVFVEEQHCPPDIEQEFEAESNHFLAYMNGIPAGCARWRLTDYGYKLERFAVLKEYRGNHIGESLLKTVLDDVPADGKPIYLHAQLIAKDFYLRYDFVTDGDHFWEAGIEHVKMILQEN